MSMCPRLSKISLGVFIVNQKDICEHRPLWELCRTNQKKLEEEKFLKLAKEETGGTSAAL